MFIIKWQTKNYRTNSIIEIEGLSRYSTLQDAEKQVTIWRSIWRTNKYIIQLANQYTI